MGLDVYLEWDDMTEEEQQKQNEVVFSIAHGAVGYLRASWAMDAEIKLYATLFYQDWDKDGDKGIAYDFEDPINLWLLEQTLERYERDPNVKPENKEQIIKSVRAFYQLGRTKQEAGLNPIIYFG